MLTFQDLHERVQKMAGYVSAEDIALGKALINETQKFLVGQRNWDWTEGTFTFTTTATQQIVKLPVDIHKVRTFKLTLSGGTSYTVDFIDDPVAFDKLNYTGTSVTSDIPLAAHIRNDRLLVYPTISSASLTGTIEYNKMPRDMTADDYTTGTITSIANGDTTVTASGSTFTSAMAGRYIRITSDGNWYKIASVTSATVLELDINFEGTTIAAATEAYTIGELPLVPEEFQEILWIRPLSDYYILKEDLEKSEIYDRRAASLITNMKKVYGTKTQITVVSDHAQFRNANYDPRAVTLT